MRGVVMMNDCVLRQPSTITTEVNVGLYTVLDPWEAGTLAAFSSYLQFLQHRRKNSYIKT